MFVLFNEKLNKYFKHPRVGGIWWTHDAAEANKMLENIKQVVVESGYSEITTGMTVLEIPEQINED
jgi:ABC-type iron transport system FetAB ATPase subunit